ncbi:MAG: ATP phosphoribosyltransferase [Dehalococcoidales bacterium]|nr:ATP phosphoribosyltransferase [Dehalococcoidales bacterium]
MQFKIALPKGPLLGETSSLLSRAGWGLDDYREGTRAYRLKSQSFLGLFAKVFQERDIPIQVAVGNYDLGICGLDWIEELLAKYPDSDLVKLRDLGYGNGAIYAAASTTLASPQLDVIKNTRDVIRLASEYPNLTESFALDLRLKRFSVFPLWGAAEAYPPENADIVLVSRKAAEKSLNHGLVAVSRVLGYSAYLIANRSSWETKDLSKALAAIENVLSSEDVKRDALPEATIKLESARLPVGEPAGETIRLALADGHQQQPTIELLTKAGISIEDYPSKSGNRRPKSSLEGVTIKVIRPQDMPLQVANGNFDLAITGVDWLTEHLNQFPASPVVELLDLKFGWVRIVAVVSEDVPVSNTAELRQLWADKGVPIRVAAEYANIADKYARDNHLGVYKVIPTWGATEAFLTEDADVLIENTQTGRTLAQNRLKIIETLFESTARLIANKDSLADNKKSRKIESIAGILRKAAG